MNDVEHDDLIALHLYHRNKWKTCNDTLPCSGDSSKARALRKLRQALYLRPDANINALRNTKSGFIVIVRQDVFEVLLGLLRPQNNSHNRTAGAKNYYADAGFFVRA